MSPSGPKQRLGRWGEELAAQYLAERGYKVLERNHRTPHGEIDLICEKDGVRIFVEVKTRSGDGFGLPEDAVTQSKQQHLLAAISAYWLESEKPEVDWRIDVIAVIRKKAGRQVEVEHFENAVRG